MTESVLDKTKHCCPRGHGTANEWKHCKGSELCFWCYFCMIFRWEHFSKQCIFDLLRWSVDMSWLNTYVNGWFVQWRRLKGLWRKRLLCSVTAAEKSILLCDDFLFKQLIHMQTGRAWPQCNCLWTVGSEIVSVLTFATVAFAELKRGHLKRYTVTLSLPRASCSFNPDLCQPANYHHCSLPNAESFLQFINPLRWLLTYGSGHKCTGRYFTGGTENICLENNNLP